MTGLLSLANSRLARAARTGHAAELGVAKRIDPASGNRDTVNAGQGGDRMIFKQSILAIMMAVCIPLLMPSTVAGADHSDPSTGAKDMPGALGTIEYKPSDWK